MLNYIRNKLNFGWNPTPNIKHKQQKSSRFKQFKSFLTKKHHQYFHPERRSTRNKPVHVLDEFDDLEKDDVYKEAMKFKTGGNRRSQSRKRRARRTRRN